MIMQTEFHCMNSQMCGVNVAQQTFSILYKSEIMIMENEIHEEIDK